MIKMIIPQARLNNPKVLALLRDLEEQASMFVRVPGESSSGICAFCAQFVLMTHDGSGADVPLPVSGTHPNCVCTDIPAPIFRFGTRATLATLADPKFRYKTRAAKKGETGQFEWLAYQSKTTQKRILGVNRYKMLSGEISAGYAEDSSVIPIKEL